MGKLSLTMAAMKLKLPRWAVALSYLGRLNLVDGRRADPQAQALGELVDMLRGDGPMPDVATSRAQLEAMAAKLDEPMADGVKVDNIMLPGAEGDRPGRVYEPGGDVAGTLLYLHGGGWVQGSLDTHDGICSKLAMWAGIRVISYDYRLAPEHPFPAGPDDVLACYLGLLGGAGGFDITADTLVVGGDSAGGNLTAVLMHDLAGQGAEMPKGQLLIYPAVDARLESRSMQVLENAFILPKKRISWFLDHYLPEDTDPLGPRVSPLFSRNLKGQPEALVIVAGQDPLWDDGQSYAKALEEAGVAVEKQEYPGQIHIFVSVTKVVEQGNDAIRKSAQWLKELF